MAKTSRNFVGVYLGGKADEVDAAVVKVSGADEAISVRQTHCLQRPLPEALSAHLRSAGTGWAMSASDLARMDCDGGEALADAAEAVMKAARVTARRVAGVGVIGRTLGFAGPGGSAKRGAAVEIGSPAIVAQRVGAVTAADFASTDLAAGGLGSPVWAWPDWLMFRDKRLSRVVVHLGSVATITFIGSAAAASDVVAYDTGPGTVLIDYLARQLFERDLDADGAIAARHQPSEALLNELLAGEHFHRPPPKRTLPADWLGAAAQRLEMMAGKHRCQAGELLATVCELTARTVASDVLGLTERPHEVILTGGGAMNIHLAGRIRTLLSPCSTYTSERYGLGLRAHGAAAAAVLAAARIDGYPAHCHNATGARQPRVLGSLWGVI